MTKMKIDDTERVEFFECDCFDKDDLIRAEYSEFEITNRDGSFNVERDLNITFTTYISDYTDVWDDGFLGWFKRIKWRITKASRILFIGRIKTEGYFMPSRSFVDTKKNKIENFFGYKTTKRFAKWLDTMADKMQDDWKNDVKGYTIAKITEELDSGKMVGVKNKNV